MAFPGALPTAACTDTQLGQGHAFQVEKLKRFSHPAALNGCRLGYCTGENICDSPLFLAIRLGRIGKLQFICLYV